MVSLPLIPHGKGYSVSASLRFVANVAHSLLALGLRRKFGCLPGGEEDSLRDCATDTEDANESSA